MSETPQQKRNQNQNRNRNRNNGNRKNNNGNRNRNRGGNNRNGQQRRNNGPRKKAPVKLSLWQKFLKAIGLYDPNKKSDSPRPQNKTASKPKASASPRQAPERTPATTPRLYIGNLSFDATESDLKDLFKGVGNVRKIEIVYHRQTQRSRGYGFIEMSSTEEAKRAIEVLHDQHFLGRKLVVNGAKAKNKNDTSSNTENAENAESDSSDEA